MDDPILFWNAVSLDCNRFDHTGPMAARNQRGPTLSSRALAIVHLAMYDAFVLTRAGEGSPVAPNDPYLPAGRRPAYSSPAGTSLVDAVAAAVSGAATGTLLTLFPSQRPLIDAALARFAASNGSLASGFAFGLAVGRAVLKLREGDGSQFGPDDPAHMESPARGRHREDPLNIGQGYLGAIYGRVRSFAVTAFQPLAPHPALSDPAYLAAHQEVLAKGAAASAKVCTRTPEETVIGIYWAYDGAKDLGTPPRFYNQILRGISAAKGLSVEQNAQLFMLANVAMGDAGVHAWHYKYHYDLWRPVVGIREWDSSMGPGATTATPPGGMVPDCDPFWRPLGAPKTNSTDEPIRTFTPPFPAYPSGHATFGAAAFHAARLYLQSIGQANVAGDGSDDVAFEAVSDELDGRSIDADDTVRTRHKRAFAGLHEAIYENAVSRVFLGVHWRFDGTSALDTLGAITAADRVGGVPLGLAIASDIFGAFKGGQFRPSPNNVQPDPFDATP